MDFTSDLSSDVNVSRNDGGHHSSSSSFLGIANRTTKTLPTTTDKSSDLELNMLSASDRKQLKLEDTREKLLLEREKLLKEVDELNIELQNTPEGNGTELPQPEELETEDTNDEIDHNMAKTLMDLMSISSRNNRFPNIDDRNQLPSNKIDGNSSMQDELASKYDTLPLLNMNVRLRYLRQYLYPHMKMDIVERVNEKSNKKITVTIRFLRNVKHIVKITFIMLYDSSEQTLQSFEISKFTPSTLNLNMRSFIKKHSDNPTAILFCLSEYDRLLWKRQELFSGIVGKFRSWIQDSFFENQSNYMDIEREIVLNNANQNNNLIRLTIKIEIPEGSVIPRSKINLEIFADGTLVTKPDVNQMLFELMKEYGLNASLKHLIRGALFP
ncbi:similar to Saccharomyces cerevisiae YPL018W CTF19 Outer kinetochore protein, required for accurate mitotic chromosome segregation [Maudiozyma barnettii]|uniref:Similar to Saccharomyces cerevisiae YPL018W CTF19 Outer kinetochore protein, required for accurate mitotic chromosome segregation n=1 Tax=Maudiozyma barnettii TaxID=61262 RepID=A0A8H2VEM1_9SACH|nr:Ctf19p [Kazachstania barnettii]CAB4254127.1 similar to Saccharomyces cerevisiae YPL018W CTF19 Outer kinetochore protein, required for accurate mitotic chromosome segregation [Kazachstania barnettii]CAD1781877.1 similar to Saccharomyces cerevisiae YPL018W CTF19 Outer kinetochore protein, required for accurate mitotic chromosome segregation [Kazachstania barnettii]